MHLKHLLSQDTDKRTATLLLYGEIGSKVDGDYLASEIRYLDQENDEITLRINSAGGSVIQGLSIFNALLNAKAYTTVHIDGIAASMAGVIPMAADRVLMNDFARIMIHSPYFSAKKDYTKLSNKEKKSVDAAKGILASLLTRRGMDSETVTRYIDEETWFTSDEALSAGIVDEIINTGKKPAVEQAIASLAAYADHDFEPFIQQPTIKKMNTISAFLGLDAAATEAQVVNEIRAITQERDSFKTKVNTMTARITELENQLNASQEAEIETMVNQAINTGHFEPTAKDALTATATADIVNFRKMVEGLKPITASLAADLRASAGAAEETHDFEHYRKNDPQALIEMKASDPAKFKKLYDAWHAANM